MKMKNYLKITILFVVLFTISCETATENEATIEEQVVAAFTKFKNGNYSSALSDFSKLVIETDSLPILQSQVYVGIGYCQLRAANKNTIELTSAYNAFGNALSRDSNNFDARAGRSIMNYSYKKSFSLAIVDGNYLINNSPDYTFVYDQTITHVDVRLHVAMSYFDLEEFSSAYNMVRTVNSNFTLSPTDPVYNTKLSAEIERLVELNN
jgi:hypothetical protein